MVRNWPTIGWDLTRVDQDLVGFGWKLTGNWLGFHQELTGIWLKFENFVDVWQVVDQDLVRIRSRARLNMARNWLSLG